MSETNHTNAGAEAPLKPGAPKTDAQETGAPKASAGRRFPTWWIFELRSQVVPLPDWTYIHATVENCPDPRDPHLYYAEITREVSTGSGIRHEHLKGKSFDDLIEALLYLESVDLGDLKTANE